MSDSLEEQEKYYGKIVGLVNSDSPNLSCAYEIEEVLLIDEYFAAEKITRSAFFSGVFIRLKIGVNRS